MPQCRGGDWAALLVGVDVDAVVAVVRAAVVVVVERVGGAGAGAAGAGAAEEGWVTAEVSSTCGCCKQCPVLGRSMGTSLTARKCRVRGCLETSTGCEGGQCKCFMLALGADGGEHGGGKHHTQKPTGPPLPARRWMVVPFQGQPGQAAPTATSSPVGVNGVRPHKAKEGSAVSQVAPSKAQPIDSQRLSSPSLFVDCPRRRVTPGTSSLLCWARGTAAAPHSSLEPLCAWRLGPQLSWIVRDALGCRNGEGLEAWLHDYLRCLPTSIWLICLVFTRSRIKSPCSRPGTRPGRSASCRRQI
jgi:hypothetical protein